MNFKEIMYNNYKTSLILNHLNLRMKPQQTLLKDKSNSFFILDNNKKRLADYQKKIMHFNLN